MTTTNSPDELFSATTALSRMRKARDERREQTLHYMEIESLLRLFDAPSDLIGNPEEFRREKPSLDAVPLPGMEDYGPAGNAIDRAVHHLDEGLPMGQRQRCALAFGMLCRGVQDLAVWMEAKGYFTVSTPDPEPPEPDETRAVSMKLVNER